MEVNITRLGLQTNLNDYNTNYYRRTLADHSQTIVEGVLLLTGPSRRVVVNEVNVVLVVQSAFVRLRGGRNHQHR